jgi:hypothetical protein
LRGEASSLAQQPPWEGGLVTWLGENLPKPSLRQRQVQSLRR